MFVVRVENDEATMFRAFRRMQSARTWAAQRDGDDADCLVDIFESAGSIDAVSAVTATRRGQARPIARGDSLVTRPPHVGLGRPDLGEIHSV